MPMYNLIEYSNNYSKIIGSTWQYCKDIPVVDNNNAIVNFAVNNVTDSFHFKAKMNGQTGNNRTKDFEIMVPLKYLSNFWRNLEMPFINYEINLILTCSQNCVVVSIDVANKNATYGISDRKFYVPVVTLSIQGNSNLLQQLNSGFKRIISWNKYLLKPELLRQNAQLNHLVKPSFQGINRLFVSTFESDTQRISAESHYLPNAELKDYNVIIDGKHFID